MEQVIVGEDMKLPAPPRVEPLRPRATVEWSDCHDSFCISCLKSYMRQNWNFNVSLLDSYVCVLSPLTLLCDDGNDWGYFWWFTSRYFHIKCPKKYCKGWIISLKQEFLHLDVMHLKGSVMSFRVSRIPAKCMQHFWVMWVCWVVFSWSESITFLWVSKGSMTSPSRNV